MATFSGLTFDSAALLIVILATLINDIMLIVVFWLNYTGSRWNTTAHKKKTNNNHIAYRHSEQWFAICWCRTMALLASQFFAQTSMSGDCNQCALWMANEQNANGIAEQKRFKATNRFLRGQRRNKSARTNSNNASARKPKRQPIAGQAKRTSKNSNYET